MGGSSGHGITPILTISLIYFIASSPSLCSGRPKMLGGLYGMAVAHRGGDDKIYFLKRDSSPTAEVASFLALPPIPSPNDDDDEDEAFRVRKRVKSFGFRCPSLEIWSESLQRCVSSTPNGAHDDHLSQLAMLFTDDFRN